MRGTEVFNENGQILKVGALVVTDIYDERKLLILSSNGKEFTFPGGHLEKGETPEVGVLREVAEETGLVVEIKKKLPDFNYRKLTNNEPVRKFMFLVKSESGDLSIENEAEALLWATEAEAMTKVTTSGEKSYIKYAFEQ